MNDTLRNKADAAYAIEEPPAPPRMRRATAKDWFELLEASSADRLDQLHNAMVQRARAETFDPSNVCFRPKADIRPGRLLRLHCQLVFSADIFCQLISQLILVMRHRFLTLDLCNRHSILRERPV